MFTNIRRAWYTFFPLPAPAKRLPRPMPERMERMIVHLERLRDTAYTQWRATAVREPQGVEAAQARVRYEGLVSAAQQLRAALIQSERVA